MTKHIYRIRCGGQTGADRGALDAAIDMGIPVTGWVPKNGWAEDMNEPPGLLKYYPQLKETSSSDVSVRTKCNVRDSHATLIILPDRCSNIPGTILTEKYAQELKRPFYIDNCRDLKDTLTWIHSLEYEITLNVAGPRESEVPGIYQKTYELIQHILSKDSRASSKPTV